MEKFWISFLAIVNSMGPYLLLGFLIAGILHVFVPKKFYNKYLSQKNKLSVIYAALLGLPLPLCSCGVIPTAIGLKNEGASKGAVASFMIATPQTGIDSILATFSLMGLGFAIVRPVAALITGICGGLLVNQLVKVSDNETIVAETCTIEHGNRLWRVLKYAFFDMMQDIGPRLLIGLLLAAIINVSIPDEFFLTFGNYPLLQMLIILAIAVPMYICSTGSIPMAAALMMKGLSPGAALVMLIAGPAVNFASILVVRKAMGRHFTWIYLLVIVGFSILFGLITNAIGIGTAIDSSNIVPDCCNTSSLHFGVFRIICSVILLLLIIIALSMKFFNRFKKQNVAIGTMVYTVEGMHCNHCKTAVEKAVSGLKGVITAEANIGKQTLTITGSASIDEIRKAVEKAGFVFKG